MSLSSINNSSSVTTAQLYGLASTSASPATRTAEASQNGSGTSRFASAIGKAFASLGISLDATGSTASSASSSASASTPQDSSDAIGAFVQSLFAALHGQSAGSTPPPPPPDDATASASSPSSSAPVDAIAQATGHAHHGHHGKIEADLQSLIQELASSASSDSGAASSAASTTTSATGTTTATTTGIAATPDAAADPTLAALEKSFDALLAKTGSSATAGNDSLTTFLQSLATGLRGAPSTGNVVSTAA